MFIRNAALLTLTAFALAGCGRDDVKVYHVAKDDSAMPQPVQIPAPEQMPTTQMQPSQQPQLQWILPTGWQEIAPSQMRVASFAVTNANGQTADVGVIPLPAGENEIDLVNMWRDQVQLPTMTNSDSQTVSVGNDPAKLFEVAGTAPIVDGKFPKRILVAELTRGATSWFFKMDGEDSFVASQKENFLQFLKSVSFVENTPAQIAAAPETQNQNTNSMWTIPPDWKQIDPGAMLFAKFSIASGDAKADVNVSELAGDGGGLLANVNRWRHLQLGLEEVDQTGLEKLVSTFDANGNQASLVDFTGTDSKTGKPARLVGAVVPQNGQTWFYKLMGDGQIVAQQKDAFIKFIQSANYSNAR
jgi:hypothetical protein